MKENARETTDRGRENARGTIVRGRGNARGTTVRGRGVGTLPQPMDPIENSSMCSSVVNYLYLVVTKDFIM